MKMKGQCLLQKFTSCCIARYLRMLHVNPILDRVWDTPIMDGGEAKKPPV